MSEDAPNYRRRLFEPERWRPAIANAYPDDFAARLLADCRLDSAMPAEDLTAYLRMAGALYLDRKAAIEAERLQKPDPVQKRRHKSQLQKISKLARLLKLQLKQLDKPAADLLWAPIGDPVTELIAANPDHFAGQLFDHKDGKAFPSFLVHQGHIDQTLTVIDPLASDAIANLTPAKGGRPPSPGLQQWVDNMRWLWTERLGLAFSVMDDDHGQSPAVIFLAAALGPLDPDITSGTLVWVMGQVREHAALG